MALKCDGEDRRYRPNHSKDHDPPNNLDAKFVTGKSGEYLENR